MKKLKRVITGYACKRSYTFSKLRFLKQLRRKWKSTKSSPIVVHTMGKVGSTTVLNAVQNLAGDRLVFHTHYLAKEITDPIELRCKTMFHSHRTQLPLKLLWRSEFLYHQLLNAGSKQDKWKFITLTRDPVARNISAFFENVFITPRGTDETIKVFSPFYNIDTETNIQDTEKLIELFFSKWADHHGPADFFEREFKGILGLDLYAKDFPRQHGYQIYSGNKADAILIRLEDFNSTTSTALAKFLGIQGIDLLCQNMTTIKPYGHVYKKIISNIKLDNSYLDEMYGSRYAKHFYTSEEIAGFRRRWTE